tara:strand:- start:58 stop:462 length:405 start_codon:yes stop_codon:yes gene_type:complete
MNGWENINGSEGHWEQTIDPSCAPGGNPTGLSLYLQTLDWQYSSGEYDVQFTQDFGTIPNVLSKHFDYTINQNGTGNYYMYSFTSPALFTCPPAPASAHPSSTGLSLEYECQWWNNGAAGTFINYQTGQTTTWP